MKKLFEKILIKRQLLDRDDNPVEGDVVEEFNALPSNYIRTSRSGNSLYKYHIIQNTYRPAIIAKLFKNNRWFETYDYTIVTNLKHNHEDITFNTEFNAAIVAQIDLHIEILYGEYF